MTSGPKRPLSLRSLGLNTSDLWVLATIEDARGAALSAISTALWSRFVVRLDVARLRVVVSRLRRAGLVAITERKTQTGVDWYPSLAKAGTELLHAIRWPST